MNIETQKKLSVWIQGQNEIINSLENLNLIYAAHHAKVTLTLLSAYLNASDIAKPILINL